MTGVERTSTRIAGFASPEMDFQLMRQLGVATAGGGAPGEIFAARAKIMDDNAFAWPAAFTAQADRLSDLAESALAAGHDVSACGHLLRASSYYRSAEYFSDPFGPDGLGYGLKSRDAFIRAASLTPHAVKPVDIPFEGKMLPGYFLQPAGGAPDGRTVIVMTGFDGTGEELYFQTAADGLARGFNLLIAEGPGQVGTLRRDPTMVFRPDYEAPIAAIVDFCLGVDAVNPEKLGLYGISFGGYFTIRGAAGDQRIRALVANSPIIDLLDYMSGFVQAGEGDEDEDVSLDEVDDIPEQYMPSSVKLGFKAACRRFGVTTFSGWFEKLEAYRATDRLADIACPVLGMVGTGEGAEALDQHKTFCDAVSGPATSRIFTVEEGADMHCQLGNLPLSNAIVYDWLADTLKD
ncbi:alpha/beta hydrolase [Hoeflea sp. WL0058]|uniref:Alpha/beta hydrolase n=1 Tax=Flavimaribacter sediminis TaxID=2865987 RepID=A0AAE2ZMV3_9HYPH|nr:alpha/beta hydrolase [Flavimaribacter sediminis]MBW8637621.1 alpha/beta hydrolase [Flavimaribacter sediminis]